jgi:hypothetical protein
MVRELDTVEITRDLPECGLVAGDIGSGRNLRLLLESGSYRRTKSESGADPLDRTDRNDPVTMHPA